MQQGFAIDSTLGFLLLVLAIALVALAASWAVRRSRTPRSAAAAPPQRETAEGTTEMLRASPTASAASDPLPRSSREPAPSIAAVPSTQSQQSTPPQQGGHSFEDLKSAIGRAEAAGDKSELAHLYIKQAAAYIADGNKDDAAASLRDAIRVAALNRLAEPHALARLELGDLYLSNGDPITACEQWQIARNLFHDLSRPADRDDVDKRMLGNGCPTDWVLTDF